MTKARRRPGHVEFVTPRVPTMTDAQLKWALAFNRQSAIEHGRLADEIEAEIKRRQATDSEGANGEEQQQAQA